MTLYAAPKPLETLPNAFAFLPAVSIAANREAPAVIPPILASIGTFASSINPTIASPAPSENNAQTPPSQMPSQMFPLCHSCAARHI